MSWSSAAAPWAWRRPLNIAKRGALTPEQAYYLTLFKGETPDVVAKMMVTGSHKVTVVEMLPKIGKGIGRSTKWIVLGMVKAFGMGIKTGVTVTGVEPGKVNYKTNDGAASLDADTVVVAAGAAPVNELAEPLKAKGLNVEVIGDASGGLTVLDAIAQGFKVGAEF